ncbi:DNA/RNA helicase domain-containing protein [Bacillus salipaludis]
MRNTYKTLMTRGMKGCYVYCLEEIPDLCSRKILEGIHL